MKRNLLFLLCLTLFLFASSTRCVAKIYKQEVRHVSAKCIKGNADKEIFLMLKQFYQDYFAALDRNANTRVVLKKYLSASFYKILLRMKHTQEKLDESFVDWDIFIQAQDWDSECLKTLGVGKDTKLEGVYVVTYIFSGDHSLVTVKLRVKKEKEKYRIDGVIDKAFNDTVNAYLHRK